MSRQAWFGVSLLILILAATWWVGGFESDEARGNLILLAVSVPAFALAIWQGVRAGRGR